MEEPEGRFELFKEGAMSRFSDWLESTSRPGNLRRLLFFGLSFDILIWSLVIAFPRATRTVFDIVGWSDLLKRGLFLSIFFVNFFVFFAALRLIFGDSSPVDVDDGPLRGFAEKAGSDRHWGIWIAAGMASALHAIIFFAFGIMAGKTVSLAIP